MELSNHEGWGLVVDRVWYHQCANMYYKKYILNIIIIIIIILYIHISYQLISYLSSSSTPALKILWQNEDVDPPSKRKSSIPPTKTACFKHLTCQSLTEHSHVTPFAPGRKWVPFPGVHRESKRALRPTFPITFYWLVERDSQQWAIAVLYISLNFFI